jgi:uncharacterized HAD superfamily protein
MRIGLDIDGVLADFPAAVIERARVMGLADYFPPSSSDVHYWGISEKFSEVMRAAWTSERFWMSLPPIPRSLAPWHFEPDCYITSRPIDSSVTEAWLKEWGFPEADVITVVKPEDKLQHILDRKIDLFVDDYYVTVEQLLESGVNAKLFKAPYQIGHSVHHLPAISNLREIYEYRETTASV